MSKSPKTLPVEIRRSGELVEVTNLPDPRVKFVAAFNELQAATGSGLTAQPAIESADSAASG